MGRQNSKRPHPSRKASKHEARHILKSLLRDPAFVDYFNVFLNLPVFGQRALFKLHSKTFIFNPPVSGNFRNHRVLGWIEEERYNLFTQTRLAHEYRLCCHLLDAQFSFGPEDENAKALLRAFCRNVIGNAAGMYLFREYLRGTCGARVISCWMHVQTFRKTQDLERRVELFSAIRRYYLHPVITLPGPGCLSDIVAADILNFPLVPTDHKTLRSQLDEGNSVCCLELDPKSRDALGHVQSVLLLALQSYWLPCYLRHVMATQELPILEKLFKRSPGDRVDQKTLKQLVRRYTIFTALAAEGSGVNLLPSTLPTMPSPTSTLSTDVSDVEYLFHWQAPSEPQPHATRHADGHPPRPQPDPASGTTDPDDPSSAGPNATTATLDTTDSEPTSGQGDDRPGQSGYEGRSSITAAPTAGQQDGGGQHVPPTSSTAAPSAASSCSSSLNPTTDRREDSNSDPSALHVARGYVADGDCPGDVSDRVSQSSGAGPVTGPATRVRQERASPPTMSAGSLPESESFQESARGRPGDQDTAVDGNHNTSTNPWSSSSLGSSPHTEELHPDSPDGQQHPRSFTSESTSYYLDVFKATHYREAGSPSPGRSPDRGHEQDDLGDVTPTQQSDCSELVSLTSVPSSSRTMSESDERSVREHDIILTVSDGYVAPPNRDNVTSTGRSGTTENADMSSGSDPADFNENAKNTSRSSTSTDSARDKEDAATNDLPGAALSIDVFGPRRRASDGLSARDAAPRTNAAGQADAACSARSSVVSDTSVSDVCLGSSSSLLSLRSWDSDTDTDTDTVTYGDSSSPSSPQTPANLGSPSITSRAAKGEGGLTHNARKKTLTASATAATGRRQQPRAPAKKETTKAELGEERPRKASAKTRRPDDLVSSFRELLVENGSTDERRGSGSSEANNNYCNADGGQSEGGCRRPRSVFSDTSSSSSSSSSEEDGEGGSESEAEAETRDEEKAKKQSGKGEARGHEKGKERRTGAQPQKEVEAEVEKEKQKETQKEKEKERPGRMEGLMLASVTRLTKVALRDVALKYETATHLASLLLHFIFGSRDIVQEDPRTDRRTLCLLACDGSAGSPLRSYLIARDQRLHKTYLDFWVAMRRYLQLRDLCRLEEVVSRQNGYEISKLVDQQVQHVAHTFLTEDSHQAGIFNRNIKMGMLDDMLNRRQSTLINATQDVVANILSVPVTQFILSDLQVFDAVVFAERGRKCMELKTFKQRRCLADPWFDEPAVTCDPETFKVPGQNGATVGILTEDHRMQAFQFLIMISEDLHTSALCDVRDLAEMIWSEFGSLHICTAPRVKNRFLRGILPYQRLTSDEIANLSTITTCYLNIQLGPFDDDQDAATEREGAQAFTGTQGLGRKVTCGLDYKMAVYLRKRRGAIEMPRPPRPRRMDNILCEENQLCFFRLFLIGQGDNHVDALDFWKACEDAKAASDSEETKALVSAIKEKFLLGSRRNNLLVNPDYVKQIGLASSLNLGYLVQMQGFVKSKLEKKWWRTYMRDWPELKAMLRSRVGYDETWEKDLLADELGHDVVIDADMWRELYGLDEELSDEDDESSSSSTQSSSEESSSSSSDDPLRKPREKMKWKRPDNRDGGKGRRGRGRGRGRRRRGRSSEDSGKGGKGGKRGREGATGKASEDSEYLERRAERQLRKIQLKLERLRRRLARKDDEENETMERRLLQKLQESLKGRRGSVSGTLDDSYEVGKEASEMLQAQRLEEKLKRRRRRREKKDPKKKAEEIEATEKRLLKKLEKKLKRRRRREEDEESEKSEEDEDLVRLFVQKLRRESAKCKQRSEPGEDEEGEESEGTARRPRRSLRSGSLKGRRSRDYSEDEEGEDEESESRTSRTLRRLQQRRGRGRVPGKDEEEEEEEEEEEDEEGLQRRGRRKSPDKLKRRRKRDRRREDGEESDESSGRRSGLDWEEEEAEDGGERAKGARRRRKEKQRGHRKRRDRRPGADEGSESEEHVSGRKRWRRAHHVSSFLFRSKKSAQRSKDQSSEEETEQSAESGASRRRWRKVRGVSRIALGKRKRAARKKPESSSESSSESDEEEEEPTTAILLSRLGVVGGVVPLVPRVPRVSDTSAAPEASQQEKEAAEKEEEEEERIQKEGGKAKGKLSFREKSKSEQQTLADAQRAMAEMKRRRNKILRRWRWVIGVVNAFRISLLNVQEVHQFEIFLKREISIADHTAALAEKVIVDGKEQMAETRTVLGKTLIWHNKLLADLHFWIAVYRYKRYAYELQDMYKTGSSAKIVFQEATQNIRAKGIVCRYLASDSPPANKINVPDYEAARIATRFQVVGACLNLFHPAFMRLMPLLINLWQIFTVEQKEKVPQAVPWQPAYQIHDYVGDNPHASVSSPDYTSCTLGDYQAVYVDPQDPLSARKRMFSIGAGSPDDSGKLQGHTIHALEENAKAKSLSARSSDESTRTRAARDAGSTHASVQSVRGQDELGKLRSSLALEGAKADGQITNHVAFSVRTGIRVFLPISAEERERRTKEKQEMERKVKEELERKKKEEELRKAKEKEEKERKGKEEKEKAAKAKQEKEEAAKKEKTTGAKGKADELSPAVSGPKFRGVRSTQAAGLVTEDDDADALMGQRRPRKKKRKPPSQPDAATSPPERCLEPTTEGFHKDPLFPTSLELEHAFKDPTLLAPIAKAAVFGMGRFVPTFDSTFGQLLPGKSLNSKSPKDEAKAGLGGKQKGLAAKEKTARRVKSPIASSRLPKVFVTGPRGQMAKGALYSPRAKPVMQKTKAADSKQQRPADGGSPMRETESKKKGKDADSKLKRDGVTKAQAADLKADIVPGKEADQPLTMTFLKPEKEVGKKGKMKDLKHEKQQSRKMRKESAAEKDQKSRKLSRKESLFFKDTTLHPQISKYVSDRKLSIVQEKKAAKAKKEREQKKWSKATAKQKKQLKPQKKRKPGEEEPYLLLSDEELSSEEESSESSDSLPPERARPRSRAAKSGGLVPEGKQEKRKKPKKAMEPVESMESGKAKVSEKDRKPETRKPVETEKLDESGESKTEKPDEARQPEEAKETDEARKPEETEEPDKAGKPDEIKKPDEATKPEEERTQKAQKFLPALKPAQVKLKAIFEESALHLPQILQKGTTQPRKSAGETTLTRSAKRVSSMVERLHEERQAGSGEVSQRAVKMGPAVVKDYGKVLDKLYQQRAKLPQPPALFVLKTEEAEALRRDRWSAKSRMMVYGEHGPQRRTRVTTPDMAETQKRRKQRKRQEEAQRESD